MDEQLSENDATTLPKDKAELLERIRRARAGLEQTIGLLSPDQIVAPGAAAGWSVKDHLTHIAVWEMGLAALLQRRPRYAAMDVDEATYRRGADATNETIYERNKGRSAPDVLGDFRRAHQELLAALGGLTEADLRRTYSYYQPDEPGEDSGAPIVRWIAGNTYEHYDEHREWIEALVR
ncbi:MAG: ClbS/DfsB family four-helix bundle protein [Chloroflexi bacterium]|nr:ClbS/DfsB family four-helix bundle protein [Chloroflexota bacterium]